MTVRAIVASMAVATALLIAACGAETVDPEAQARVVADTCRGLQERSTGRPARPVDVDLIERVLRSEPGGENDMSSATLTRRVCQRAMSGEVPEG